MSHKVVQLVAGLCLASVGCAYTGNATGGWDLYRNSIRNLGEEPGRVVDWVAITNIIQSKTDAAWRAVAKAHADHPYSTDYECGYKAGYRDYLEAGGNGQPPAVPPPRYRTSGYRNPEGQEAIKDWYAGFAHGARDAMASGLRHSFLVPLASHPPLTGSTTTPELVPPGP